MNPEWSALPLRRLATCLDYVRIPLNAEERHHRPGDVPYWGANAVQGYVDEALVSEPVVLLGEDGAPFFDKDRPVAFYSTQPIWPNNHIHVLKPRPHIEGRWLTYALNDVDYSLYIDGSTRDKLTQGSMMSIAVPVPQRSGQVAIADYLDRETAQIDALTEKQQQLIVGLREHRTSLIFKYVTKGCNLSVTMRESGHWMGVVPRHWVPKRLKYSLASHRTGFWGGEPNGGPDDTAVIRVADFDRHQLTAPIDAPTLRSISPEERRDRLVRNGDLLLEKSGGTGVNPVGFVAIAVGSGRAISSNFVSRLRVADGQDSRYWLYAHAASYSTRLTQKSVKQTTGIQNLDQNSYFDEVFPFPPLAEQEAIVREIEHKIASIDLLIKKARSLIDVGRERRSALITAAVTGQIDVRSAA